ncbi:MAG: bacterioferritin [Gammaproteobacteria bacterium]|nr:MAG: bacterioferritin [Gammaproteobacteria bacterium]
MQGSKTVINSLNDLLAGELGARDQYFIHSLMYDEWGYTQLFEHSSHESEHEKLHAELLARRIMLLGGTPVSAPISITVGGDVIAMLKADLAVEYQVRDNLKAAIKLCEEKQDYVTRDMLVGQLEDTEEDHAHWLEKQLGLIEAMGLPNYLQCKAHSS